jgi:short-subunit dehydrogenase
MTMNGASPRLTAPGLALITGASSGIGAEFARQLAAAGHDLVLVARRQEMLAALAAELTGRYAVRAEVLAADLSSPEDIRRVEEAIRARPDLGVLVNNAGFGTNGHFMAVPIDRSQDMIAVHIIASVRLAHAALPAMVERGRGDIINVSSIAAFFTAAGGATYGATKAYLNVFSEALQVELAGTGVRVQALCPGFTTSGFHDTPAYEGFDRSAIPDRLWMTAESVVRESLESMPKGKVIVIPGRQYKLMAAAATGPFGGSIRSTGRRLAARFRGRAFRK